MKKLGKKMQNVTKTIEGYACSCSCNCSGCYCTCPDNGYATASISNLCVYNGFLHRSGNYE
ncbi:MAG TPA: CLI_3235 family bacteriocin precursor [Bacillota bacterium]|nr:CLI_3235 family bacteriocin precursor [Bacillota bacterium]